MQNQGRFPYTTQGGEVPAQTPNGTVRHEGNRPDAMGTYRTVEGGKLEFQPAYTWRGNRTGEGSGS